MSDETNDPTVKVARDLTEILSLYGDLAARAEDRSADRLMPGGGAMVALGNVANMEAWENMHQATERYGRAYTSVEDEDPDVAWTPYQLLEYWSEQWRKARDAEYVGHRTTIATEAQFIRSCLPWAIDNELGWDDFVKDVNRARVKLENILYAGERQQLTRIECDRCLPPPPKTEDQKPKPPRLIKLYGSDPDGSQDDWKCPRCKHRFDAVGVRKCHAKMLLSEGSARWVHQQDAIATLKDQGRPERTIRQWLSEGEGDGYCDPVTHEVWVWWPSLWTKHLVTPTRKRSA